MKKTALLATLLFSLVSFASTAQRGSGPNPEISAGDLVPDGLVVLYCTSPDADGRSGGYMTVTMDKSIVGETEWFLYSQGQLLDSEDLLFGLSAGEYTLEVHQDGKVILDEEVVLNSGSQDYTVHFHELLLAEKATSTSVFEFTVYPNPTKDAIVIEGLPTEELDIEVLDEQGRKVFSDKKAEGGGQHAIDLSTSGNGVYTIHITSKDGSNMGTQRVVVER